MIRRIATIIKEELYIYKISHIDFNVGLRAGVFKLNKDLDLVGVRHTV